MTWGLVLRFCSVTSSRSYFIVTYRVFQMSLFSTLKWDSIHINGIVGGSRTLFSRGLLKNREIITVKLPEPQRTKARDVMTAATGGRKLNNPANVCCAAKARALPPRTTWSRGLPFPPRHRVWWAWPDPSHLPDLVLQQHTCPRIQPRQRADTALWFILSNFLQLLRHFIILYKSVCLYFQHRRGRGCCCWRRFETRQPGSSLTSNPQIQTLEINLFAVLEHNVQFKVVHSVGGSIQILYLWKILHYK